jgi:hypothetical protein
MATCPISKSHGKYGKRKSNYMLIREQKAPLAYDVPLLASPRNLNAIICEVKVHHRDRDLRLEIQAVTSEEPIHFPPRSTSSASASVVP